jgi:calcineurin-like phosphoesterase family protein
MSSFFTADHHFAHEGIIEMCQRPFANLKRMERALIKNYNEVVGDDDDVYFLGDFSLKRARYRDYYHDLLDRMKGNKHLILGNHDKLKPFTYVEVGFYSVHTWFKISTLGHVRRKLALVHDPALAVTNRDMWFLCGHAHDIFKIQRNVLNVGVDVWDYRPVPLDTVVETIRKYEERHHVP